MLGIEINEQSKAPGILVMGIGGGGNNAVGRMIGTGVQGVTYAAVNTDLQVLNKSSAGILLQIGKKLTEGFGAGSDPTVGEAAAEESVGEINNIISGHKMVILTCGMGGGTGTGAIPVIARCCKEMGILVMAVITLPFSFEGSHRMTTALAGLEKLKENVDTYLVIPNDKLLTLGERTFYLEDAFLKADSVLGSTISGITNIIYNCGVLNLDFSDIKACIGGRGAGHFGLGRVNSKGSLMDAMKEAINSPLLDTDITGAEKVLFNVAGKINLMELNEALSYLREIVGDKVKMKWGTVTGNDMDSDEIVITLIATGLKENIKESCISKNKEFCRTLDNKKNEGMDAKIGRAVSIDRKENREVVIPPFLTEWMSRNRSECGN